ETAGAAFLLAATVAALVWVNVDAGSYERVWQAVVAIRVGPWHLEDQVRGWINSGLMTLFFFTVGLEARREFDIGELRERSRLALPVLAGTAGMLVPVAIYLAVNAGRASADGWGTTLSTDTAFALGVLALIGPRFGDRLRIFLLTVAVVDDIVSLLVIGVFYTADIAWMALAVAAGFMVVLLAVRAARIRLGVVYAVLGLGAWVAVFESGVDPVVVGLVVGLLTYAYPAARGDLERASELFRLFREQPTPELARDARIGVVTALSPNDRLQQLYHPWVSFLIVPLFALCNAGVAIDAGFLARAYTSPITLGIVLGYLLGKPAGITAMAALVTRVTRGRLRPPVGWASVLGVGVLGGLGFTVSLLVATLAFEGEALEEAKLGVLTAALGASILSWTVFRVTAMFSAPKRARALLGTAQTLVDLSLPVDPDRDHLRGPADGLVTVVEYGDFECPYCGQAEPSVRELLAGHGEIRYVWRHLPLTDVHPRAYQAAQAAEAAAEQGAFWQMHDLLLAHQDALRPADLVGYAAELGLDVARFQAALGEGVGMARIAEDVDSADASGVSGTPTFFIDGRRHQGAYDIDSLSDAVRLAKARAAIAAR
ncbi:MAG TPA: Na+/H+ antiporter NhaA, partial [Rugosimonospora sp.]|nr:Na+/H+ antiporter NhaA [Rugosimonospora sp.]